MAVRLLYFAWVREAVGVGEETLDPPPEAVTLDALIDWLVTLTPGHRAAFADRQRLRAAIDQRFVGMDSPIANAREIAIFPPVTGG